MINKEVLLIPPDEIQLAKIRNNLGEDPGRLENNVKLFKEWLKFSLHLPDDVDERLIENFIRLCKHNLEKAKNKFEAYVALKPKYGHFFFDRALNEDNFYPILLHRNMVPMPKLTDDGYRVICFRLDSPDPSDTNYDILFKYFSIFLDFALYNDVSAGLIPIYDMAYFNMPHMGKINLGYMKSFVELLYKIVPFRLKQIHVVNIHPLGETLINITKAFMTEKLKNRMLFHKGTNSLLDHIPAEVLVKEYSGTGESLDSICERWRDYLLSHNDWLLQTESLKLTGPMPKAKQQLYSFDDYVMTGSFRQLSID